MGRVIRSPGIISKKKRSRFDSRSQENLTFKRVRIAAMIYASSLMNYNKTGMDERSSIKKKVCIYRYNLGIHAKAIHSELILSLRIKKKDLLE